MAPEAVVHDQRRLVVCLPSDQRDLLIPPSTMVEMQWIYGGIRSLHELAFAAAQTGREVELRGWVDKRTFDDLAAATDARPLLAQEPRSPTSDDILVLPEGHVDPMAFAAPWLSGAQFVLMAMAPLGLLGWSFASPWEAPSPLTVATDDVNRPGSFKAIRAMGMSIWTNSEVLARMAAEFGIQASDVGNGTPLAFPEPAEVRPVDVVWLQDNRWSPFARELAQDLPCSVDAVEAAGNAELLRRFGRSKILLYPARIEGESRIAREARRMGCVPVVPRGNPLGARLEEADGVLAVDRADQIPSAISQLLADPDRLRTLSERGVASAREEVAWEPFIARIVSAIDSLPAPGPGVHSRAAIGAAIQSRLGDLNSAVDELRQSAAELEAELERCRTRNIELEVELDKVRRRKDELEDRTRQLDELLSQRSVRWSVAARDIVRRR